MKLFADISKLGFAVILALFVVCLIAIASSSPAEAGTLGAVMSVPLFTGLMGQTSGIEKSVKCTAAVAEFTIAKFGADDDTLSTATASTETLIGIFQHATTAAGDEVRTMLTGISKLKLGGTVTRGDYLTSDASGQGVAIGAVAATNYNSIARALASGVSGDIIPVLICQSRPQG